ncbi:MAG TPA: hypothetical protein DCM05_01250 [Elusimicrobia bacterium]|nr:hypothetical protein [Elusimicrobiota bacterium]
MTRDFGLFRDLDCGYEELAVTDHFCIQMLADDARVRIYAKKNDRKARFVLKWVLCYADWKFLHTLMNGVALKDRDICLGPVEYRYLPVGRAALWIKGKQFKFEGTLGEFRGAVLRAHKKIMKIRS